MIVGEKLLVTVGDNDTRIHWICLQIKAQELREHLLFAMKE